MAALPATILPTIVRYPGDRHLTYQELLPLVMAALPRSEPFILLGESFSGPLAMMAAAQRPKGLIGVILCATFVTPPWPIIGSAISLLARLPLFHFYLPYKRVKARIGGYSTPEHRAVLAEMHRLVRSHVIAARVRMVFRVDAREALRSCEVSMLYMQGSKDFVVPARNLRTMRQINPGIQVARIDSSHMLLQRHAIKSAAAISNFASWLSDSKDVTHQS